MTDEATSDLTVIVGMLVEYTTKLREVCRAYDSGRWRSLAAFMTMAGAAWTFTVAAFALKQFVPAEPILTALAAGFLFAGTIFVFTYRRRQDSLKEEIETLYRTLSIVLRHASQLHEYAFVGFTDRLSLDLRMGEGETALHLAERYLSSRAMSEARNAVRERGGEPSALRRGEPSKPTPT